MTRITISFAIASGLRRRYPYWRRFGQLRGSAKQTVSPLQAALPGARTRGET